MTRLLAVDDEQMNLFVIEEALTDEGYQIDTALDGLEALEKMATNRYDMIVLDRMMPRLDGMGLLRRMKADPSWADVPVIMQTAAASQQDVREGLEAGAYYYLTKPYEPQALVTLVRNVLSDLAERARLVEATTQLNCVVNMLGHGEFTFHTLEEARELAAALSRLCKESDAAGLGLSELLINAVEHGNLGITYAEKSILRKEMRWEDEVERRLASADFGRRRARVAMRRDGDEIEFTIRDEGAGFDWTKYLEMDPDRAFDMNGRGIAMARMLGFSNLEYQGTGSTVVARTTKR